MRGPSIIPLWLGLALLAICGTTVTALARSGAGEDPDGIEFFEKSIRPILAEKCQKCHGGDKAKGGLSLTGREALLKGGDSGPAAVPGQPRDSLLIQAVEQRGDLKMPPKGKLSPGEIERLGRWIERGLPWPEAEVRAAPRRSRRGAIVVVVPADSCDAPTPREGYRCAAFRDRPVHPGRPGGAGCRPAAPGRQTHPDPPRDVRPDRVASHARRGRCVRGGSSRRMPSPGSSTGCWPRPVTASDGRGTGSTLVRYTDEFDEVWRYRDWVIRAFNDDLPYDRFIIDQVAGDLVPAPAPGAVNADGIVATTCWRSAPGAGSTGTKRLADIVDDQIDTIGRSFLGLTIACARCHDHKFDPIPTADYYGLAGFFFSSRILSDLSYLSHTAPRLKVPLAPTALVEEHRRRTARVREAEDRLQAAVDRHYAAFARGLLPRLADYLLASWDYRSPSGRPGRALDGGVRPAAGLAGVRREGLDRLPGRPRRARSAGWIGRSATSTASGASPPGWPPPSGPGGRTTATDHDVAIETFLLPPRSVSVNPGVEGGAVGWRSPVSGTVRVVGRLTDGDPYDGTGVAWAIDHLTKNGQHQLASGRLPNGGSMRLDQGRLADGLAAVRVEAGDMIQLGVALGQGDAHYDITNVELTISLREGADEWDLARDARADFLASNPLGDSSGHPGVWQFDDMAGSHRVDRLPALDRRLAGWDAGAADRHRRAGRP